MLNAGFATTMVAVGSTVSMLKLAELVVPAPALPARSLTPVLFRADQVGGVCGMPTSGVKVAVQVIPPSLLLTVLRVPLGMLRSALVNR